MHTEQTTPPTKNIEKLLAIDPGSDNSGIVIFENDELLMGGNWINEDLFTWIDMNSVFAKNINLTVVFEDIRPYTSRFNMETINTCKVIGRMEYILKQQRIPFRSITRNEVKNYVFRLFYWIALPEIIKKIQKKGKLTKKGLPLKPSFQYVDDRIVQKAMAEHWKIPQPKPGKKNRYGISKHAWQALGVATLYLSTGGKEGYTSA